VRMFYRPGSPTAAIGDTFHAKRGGRLSVVRVGETHCAVPATRLPALLSPAAGPDPDAIDDEAADAGDDLSVRLGLCPPGVR